MWQVDNRTPFAAERGWVRDRDGAEVWLVAVKATFDIQPDGSTEVVEGAAPRCACAEYHGEPGKSSIKYEADLVLTKTTTDIIVVGHAYAPGGHRDEQLDVGFRVGPVQKILRVFGDRTWGMQGAGRSAAVHEDAAGLRAGIRWCRCEVGEPRKGLGLAQSRRGRASRCPLTDLAGRRLPNIEYPEEPISAWDDRPPPAGFGVIGSHWQPRAALPAPMTIRGSKARQPLLPDDFDDRFFQCAPADQQAPAFLRGGEPVVLKNLTPSGDLRFLLPAIEIALETRFMDGERRQHESPPLHTIILEPDFPRVSMVWHSALECHAKMYQLASTRVVVRRHTMDSDDEESVDNLLDLV